LFVTVRLVVEPLATGGGGGGPVTVLADDPPPPQAKAVAESKRAETRVTRALTNRIRMESSLFQI
jgi:hypothetical protein